MSLLQDFNVIDTRKVDEKITVHNGERQVERETYDRRTVTVLEGGVEGMPERLTKNTGSWRNPQATVDFRVERAIIEWTPNRFAETGFRRYAAKIEGRQLLKGGGVGVKERSIDYYYTQAEADAMNAKRPDSVDRSERIMPEWLAKIAELYDPDGQAYPFAIQDETETPTDQE